jgi:hypothetical protein
MHDPKNTAGTVEADEDILTNTVSDEALEAAAGTQREAIDTACSNPPGLPSFCEGNDRPAAVGRPRGAPVTRLGN